MVGLLNTEATRINKRQIFQKLPIFGMIQYAIMHHTETNSGTTEVIISIIEKPERDEND